jgi:hypothetical protein
MLVNRVVCIQRSDTAYSDALSQAIDARLRNIPLRSTLQSEGLIRQHSRRHGNERYRRLHQIAQEHKMGIAAADQD